MEGGGYSVPEWPAQVGLNDGDGDEGGDGAGSGDGADAGADDGGVVTG